MASYIIPDTIKDAQSNLNQNGLSVIRTMVVGGLSGPEAARMIEALAVTGVSYGSSHPNVAALICTNMSADPLSDDTAFVKITYTKLQMAGIDAPIVEYSSSLTNELLDDDLDNPGKPMWVYWWADGTKAGNFGDAKGHQQATIPVLRPIGNLKVTRYLLLASNDTSSLSSLNDYVGKMNASSWRGKAKRTWLCTSFDCPRIGTSLQYLVTMTFSYQPKTWDLWARFIDPYTGRPPGNIKKNETTPKKSNGFAKFRGYTEGDFDALYTALGNF